MQNMIRTFLSALKVTATEIQTRHPMDVFKAVRPSQANRRIFAVAQSSDQAVLVRAEQIRAAYKLRVRTGSRLIGGLLLVIGMYKVVPTGTLAGWLIALYTAIGYLQFLDFQYTRAAPPPEQAGKWGTRLIVGTFLFGSAWGSVGIVMFQPELTGHQMLLIFGLLLVTFVGGSTGYTSFLPLVYAFTIPAIAPLLIRSVMAGDFEHLMVAAGGTLFLGVILYYAAQVNGLIAESIKLRFENELARKSAEDANRAKSRFLAAASHDVRQPLHALSLYSAALKVRAPDVAVSEIAGHINKALASLSTLVDSLLDISKLDAGAVQPEPRCVGLRALMERIEADYRPVAREKGLEFRVVAANILVNTDPVLLERLVRNLVDNAFKYTAAGSVDLAAELYGRQARITVRDTGAGIPAAERERIFEEFYQIGNPERDRSQGLGLGLAIVRRLAQLLRLEVELGSEPGRGSIFSVTMPCEPERRAATRPPGVPAAPNSRALHGAQVLVIDDEPEVRSGMQALLEQLGCRVAACSGYAEAERLLDERVLRVDVIVADFRLRQHENGIDTVRRLRAHMGEDVPALLVSGDTAPERLREAQSSGLPLLHKPVSADKLTETMLAVLSH